MAIDGIKIAIKGFRNIYDLLYECLTDKDFERPLTIDELMDPESEFVQIMYYMYSLEPPIYFFLN